MYSKNKRKHSVIRDYAIGWTFGFIVFMAIRSIGTIEEGGVRFDTMEGILAILVIGPFVGGLSGYSQYIFEERFYRRMSAPKLLGVRAIFSISFMVFLTFLTYSMSMFVFNQPFLDIIDFVTRPGSAVFYLYVFFLDFSLAVIRQVNLMLGPGTLLKFIRGDFYYPQEEDRIFMFLDLKSSTTIAEKLGHLRYSMLIQDCFEDLVVVNEYGAQIYQYVGDEAVLTWPVKRGLQHADCINAYFRFLERLEEKRDLYMARYGMVPEFKAGMNNGIVTVAEVGKYKKEIAYHGDTINTAARIQGQCNKFNCELLISCTLQEALGPIPNYEVTKLGSLELKGKARTVEIHSVRKKGSQKAATDRKHAAQIALEKATAVNE